MESSVILNGLFNKNVNIIFVVWHDDFSLGLLYSNEKLVNCSFFSTETQKQALFKYDTVSLVCIQKLVEISWAYAFTLLTHIRIYRQATLFFFILKMHDYTFKEVLLSNLHKF